MSDMMGENLVSPRRTIEIIKKYEFTFRKKFGQNFLIDERVIGRIIEAADLTQEDCVLEIGPGIGALTQYLAGAAGQVVAVEIDQKLIPILKETLAGSQNVTVIHQDILKTDLQAVAEEFNGLYQQYIQNPDVVYNGVFRTRVGKVLRQSGATIVVPETDGGATRLILPNGR